MAGRCFARGEAPGSAGQASCLSSGLLPSPQDSAAAVAALPALPADELRPEELGPMFVHLWVDGVVDGFFAVVLALELSAGEAGPLADDGVLAVALELVALLVATDFVTEWVVVCVARLGWAPATAAPMPAVAPTRARPATAAPMACFRMLFFSLSCRHTERRHDRCTQAIWAAGGGNLRYPAESSP